MGDDGRQTGLIGQNVDQAAAQDDGVAQREGLERRSQQHAAADFRLNVEVVGDFEIVHHGFEHFVHIAAGRQQADALEAIRDVAFGLAVPGALRLNRGQVVG